MSRKKTVVDETVADAGDKTSRGADCVESPKLFERIVPIPQIDSYSEIPFALVQRNGKPILGDEKSQPAKARSGRKKSPASRKRPATAAKKKTTARAGRKARKEKTA